MNATEINGDRSLQNLRVRTIRRNSCQFGDATRWAVGSARRFQDRVPSRAQRSSGRPEEGARRAAERFVAADPKASVRARLRAIAEADVSVMREQEAFIKVVVREAMSFRPDAIALIGEHLGPYVLVVAGVLTDGVAGGSVRDDRPADQLALLFVGALSLLYAQHRGSRGAWPPWTISPSWP